MNLIFRLLIDPLISKGRVIFSSTSVISQKRYFSMDASSEKRVDLRGLRTPYDPQSGEKDFSIKDPIKLFDVWFNVAHNTDSIKEANAMAVATADKSGKPSVRYVLLKGYGKEGFTFYTNYDSRKGKEIAENPRVALLFYWDTLSRQVRIEGSIVKLSEKESEDYFHMRPRSSQLSAIVSTQSEVIENKESLIKKKEELEQIYPDGSAIIPKPSYWGGFLVIPESIEFWCGRSDRFHDRIRFRKPTTNDNVDEKFTHTGENGWIYEYLAP